MKFQEGFQVFPNFRFYGIVRKNLFHWNFERLKFSYICFILENEMGTSFVESSFLETNQTVSSQNHEGCQLFKSV